MSDGLERTATTDDSAGAGAHDGVGHIVPLRVLTGVILVLLLLTALTVMATWVSLGALNVWIALTIATAKAALVVLYFMHLRYDRPFNGVVLIVTLFFVALFVGLALLDVFEYRENVDSFRSQNPTLIAPQLEAERARLKPNP
jgi:cytochrome c oxidase subunit 4